MKKRPESGCFRVMDTPEMVRYTSGHMPEVMPVPEAPKKPVNGEKPKQWVIRPRDPSEYRAKVQELKTMEDLAREKAKDKGVTVPSLEQPVSAPPTEMAPTQLAGAGELWEEDVMEKPPQTLRSDELALAHSQTLEKMEPAPPTLRSLKDAMESETPSTERIKETPVSGELAVGSVKGSRLEYANQPKMMVPAVPDEQAPRSLRPGQLPPLDKAANG